MHLVVVQSSAGCFGKKVSVLQEPTVHFIHAELVWPTARLVCTAAVTEQRQVDREEV